jgi:hypothetical protein
VVIENVVDGSLLGGFVAEIGSVIVDGSLDGQLERLRRRMAGGSGHRAGDEARIRGKGQG